MQGFGGLVFEKACVECTKKGQRGTYLALPLLHYCSTEYKRKDPFSLLLVYYIPATYLYTRLSDKDVQLDVIFKLQAFPEFAKQVYV